MSAERFLEKLCAISPGQPGTRRWRGSFQIERRTPTGSAASACGNDVRKLAMHIAAFPTSRLWKYLLQTVVNRVVTNWRAVILSELVQAQRSRIKNNGLARSSCGDKGAKGVPIHCRFAVAECGTDTRIALSPVSCLCQSQSVGQVSSERRLLALGAVRREPRANRGFKRIVVEQDCCWPHST